MGLDENVLYPMLAVFAQPRHLLLNKTSPVTLSICHKSKCADRAPGFLHGAACAVDADDERGAIGAVRLFNITTTLTNPRR